VVVIVVVVVVAMIVTVVISGRSSGKFGGTLLNYSTRHEVLIGQYRLECVQPAAVVAIAVTGLR
jgi:hypothetical protein